MTQTPEHERPEKPKAGRAAFRDRTVTITMSLPKAVFSVAFSLFLLTWVFIFGIMLGRGHNPEEIVPELASVMPSPAEQVVQPDGKAALAAQPGMGDVIPPRDLQYHDSLKGKSGTEKPRTTTAPQTRPTPPKPPAASRPQASTPKPAAPAAPRITPTPPGKDQAMYNYIYQVASFTNSASAESMQKKLRAGGLSATVSSSKVSDTTWFRVLVMFTGRPEDTRTLREKLAPYGITNIMLREKVPAKKD